MDVRKEIKDMLPDFTDTRRKLHRIPETAFEERETQALLLSRLSELFPDHMEAIALTGVKAVWYARSPRGTIGFRADIDGLSTCEENDADYASEHPGKMHGCGHDGHMTMLLMFARLISANREALEYNVVLLFQPAEEGRCGAARMIAEGALHDPEVDRIYGLHLWPDVPKGKIGIRWGPMMARSCEFDIICRGRSAHGASPQMGVDAVVASAELITMLQSVISRSIDPHQDALLTIGRIHGGTARNIIADRVEMNATLRVFSDQVYDGLLERIHAMAQGVAVATGADFQIIEKIKYPCVDNPRPMVERLYSLIDMEDVVLVEPAMASEDFACYQLAVPGLFIFIGCGGGRNSKPLHNSRFDFDEDALLFGTELLCRILGI